MEQFESTSLKNGYHNSKGSKNIQGNDNIQCIGSNNHITIHKHYHSDATIALQLETLAGQLQSLKKNKNQQNLEAAGDMEHVNQAGRDIHIQSGINSSKNQYSPILQVHGSGFIGSDNVQQQGSHNKYIHKINYQAEKTSGTVQQGTGNAVHQNYGADEAQCLAQHKDLQRTIDCLMGQLEFQVGIIEKYHVQFLKLEQESRRKDNRIHYLEQFLETSSNSGIIGSNSWQLRGSHNQVQVPKAPSLNTTPKGNERLN